MLTILVNFIIIIINFIDNVLRLFFRINFRGFFYDKLRQKYKNIYINKKKIFFFSPNHVTDWRIDSFFSKEPETLDWIKKFKNYKNKKLIFWDIGSNIGLYSIYSAIEHKKIKVFSFEPSFLNLGIISRNISINKIEDKIKIVQLPLSNKKNKFQDMMETTLTEGGALSSFGYDYNHEGKKFFPINSYSILGTSLDYMIDNKILEIPDYIKIDVDGTEHIILDGFNKNLKNKRIKSILIEVNKKNKKQFQKIKKIMKSNNFQLKSIEQSKISRNSDLNVYNYIFFKK